MGCDIHCYIEYKKKEPKKFDSKDWMSFGGRINPSRNYWMFGFMAGVRCQFQGSKEPKGLPEDIGYIAEMESRLYINHSEKSSFEIRDCSLEDAKRWESHGYKITYDKNGKEIFVEDPDWHSYSWLSTEEFKECLNLYYQNFP